MRKHKMRQLFLEIKLSNRPDKVSENAASHHHFQLSFITFPTNQYRETNLNFPVFLICFSYYYQMIELLLIGSETLT